MTTQDIKPLSKWNPRTLKLPFSALMIASRNSGKSTLIRYLYENYWATKFDITCVFCPTDYHQKYPEFIPGTLFFEDFDPAILRKIQALQKKRMEDGKKAYQVLIIFDDCSDDRERYMRDIQYVFTKGRHSMISVLFATQSSSLTSTVWRNNADAIFLSQNRSSGGRDQLVDNYFSGLSDEDDRPEGMTERRFYNKILKKYTSDNKFIVITFNGRTNEFVDMVQWFKAPIDQQKKKKKKTPAPKDPERVEMVAEIETSKTPEDTVK